MLWFVLQAETRAEFAERSVAKLEKTIDDLEGNKDTPVSASASTGMSAQCQNNFKVIRTYAV